MHPVRIQEFWKTRLYRFGVFATVLAGGLVGTLTAAESDAPGADDESTRFIRVRRDTDDNPIAMETAVVRYLPKDQARREQVVDLVAAVHVADQDYYDQLNRLFESYDVVLYELVAAKGTRVPRHGNQAAGNPVSALQNGIKSMLELSFQLDHIDYSKENMVHADMSPEEFASTMKERGESFMQMFFRMMGQSMAVQSSGDNQATDARILLALFSKDRARQLKVLMAEQFEDLQSSMIAFTGPDGSTIITERNKKALQVLSRQLDDSKAKVAIFYGAGHMADFEERLIRDFNMVRGDRKWISAWKLVPNTKRRQNKNNS